MPNKTLQSKLDRIQEKVTLYEKRIRDARNKNRPDIERIWLDEIRVLDEERDTLLATDKQNNNSDKLNQAVHPNPPSSAKNSRRLRQLDNQIQYIKRKITIHGERGETAAVNKQTALLNDLLREKDQLSSQHNPQNSPATVPANTQPPVISSTHSLSSTDQKKIDDLNRDIAHTDKMIAEYQRFKSPKAQHWIGRKFQLVAQRDQLLRGNHQTSTATATPPPLPAQPHVIHQPQNTRQGTGSAINSNTHAIAAAQATNKQVRVLDLEIAHADKMIREYKKYNSPKASQWIQRKNELLARRAQVTGQSSQHLNTAGGGAQDAAIQKRLRIIDLEVAHADKMIREYQKYNSPKANDWIERKNHLLAEKRQFTGSGSGLSQPQPITSTQTQPTDRASIKAQIGDLNRKAKEADTNMRVALKQGNHQQANSLHQQRDDYNQKVKELTALLSGASTPHQNTGGSSNNPTGHTNTTGQGQPVHQPTQNTEGQADTQEKAIAHKYLTSRSYSNEHAYMEVIDILLSQSQYQHLIPAKETLYDITHPSKLPPAGTVINNPYIRDCFKIKISGVRLEGYRINDTIFDTSFPRDFNAKIDRINQHVGPAPALKYYKHLAHRDAIQLIPSDRNISRYNSQFAGAMLKDIVIKDIKVRSQGALQGLFASDGAFKNIHMENISVQTNSAHQIAILGLLSGTLDLSSPTGKPVHVNLLPLRLAGGNNLYINSFSHNSSYQYDTVNAGQSNAIIADNRQKMTKRGTYYQDFNMEDFFAALRRSDSSVHILTRIKEAAKTAGTVARVI